MLYTYKDSKPRTLNRGYEIISRWLVNDDSYPMFIALKPVVKPARQFSHAMLIGFLGSESILWYICSLLSVTYAGHGLKFDLEFA